MKRRRGLTNYRSSRAFEIFKNCLTIEALENDLTIKHSKSIYYCIDGSDNWIELPPDTESLPIRLGHRFSVKAELQPSSEDGIGTMFMSKKCSLSGNIYSITITDDIENGTINNVEYQFYKLFENNTGIVYADKLILPSNFVGLYGYAYMFKGCTSLLTTPIMNANVYNTGGCYSMFEGCTSLTTAPELQARDLGISVYHSMFKDCTSLTAAPDLPASSLADECYKDMFNGCSNLNYVKALFDTTATNATTNWLLGVSEDGTFIKSTDAKWDITGPDGIPEGWVIINRKPYDSSWKNTSGFNFTGNEYILTDIDVRNTSYYIETGFTHEDTELDKFRTVFKIVSYDNISLALKYSNRTDSDVIGYASYWNENTSIPLTGIYSNDQTVIFDSEVITMGDTSYDVIGSSSNYPMNLMIGNEYTADENGGISSLGTDSAWIGTINYITIKNSNGHIINQLVPVTKTLESGQIVFGFKDTVSNNVYECSYINEPPVESLEYISFNGSQYMLTDINVNTPPYYLEVKFEDLDETVDKYRPIFGVISAQADQPDPNSGAYTKCYLSCNYSNNSSSNIIGYAVPWNINEASTTLTCAYSSLNTIEFTPNGVSINGETFSLPAEIRSSEKPMNLMLGNVYYANSNGSVSSFKYNSSNGWLGNIYYVIIKDSSGNAIHELRPEKTHLGQYTFRDVITNKVYYMKNR